MFKGHLISIIYFITVLVFGALAWFEQDEGVDIAYNGTYIIIPKTVLWLTLAGLFFLFSLIALAFELFRKPMNIYLFATHYLLTIAGIIIIYFATEQQQNALPTNTSDYSLLEDIQTQPEETIDWIVYAIYTLVGAQIIFLLNILVSMIKSRRHS